MYGWTAAYPLLQQRLTIAVGVPSVHQAVSIWLLMGMDAGKYSGCQHLATLGSHPFSTTLQAT